MNKYKLKVKNEDGKDYEEEVEIDTEKETETFHVRKTSPDQEEADIVFDFKKVGDVKSLNVCLNLLSKGRGEGKRKTRGERGRGWGLL